MAVSINKTTDVSVEIVISAKKEDYQEKLDKALKTCQRTVDVKGFRPGKVPMAIVQKKYGLSIKIDTLNKHVAEILGNTLEEEKFEYLAQPILKMNGAVDFENSDDFEFTYELALKPELDIKLTKKNKLPYYKIEASEEIVKEQINNMLNQYGEQVEVDDIQERDIVKGDLMELDAEGCIKEEGISLEEALIMPAYLKDEAIKNELLAAKKGDTIKLSAFQAYAGHATEIASFLKIEKEDVENYKDVTFQYVVKSIQRHKPAELNDSFFQKAFGQESDIKDEASLKAQIVTSLEEQFKPESDMKLYYDICDLIKEKTKDVVYADEILKKFVLEQDENMTEEKYEAEKEQMYAATTVNLYKDQILKDNEVKIENEDLEAFAREVAKSQFLQYGMNSLPDEILDNYAKSMLEKNEFRQQVIDRILNDRFTSIMKEKIALEEKVVTPEEFGKIINPEA